MAFIFNDPFETLFNFQQALDQLRTSSWLDAGLSGQGTFPPLNVFRKGDDIVIIAEVPGVKKADLRIEAKGDTIRIAGSRTVGLQDKASVHRRERRSGSFDRAIALPIEIDADAIRAECRDGVLALYVPRAERDKPRAIAIK
ncbi:MAG: Hsp20/alpha crystallin family protein [Alphaproteobacteria bacterium]|nr:Hsp20/alpha crystallin family protein [Alphaproteobacteria bacterium]